VRQGGSSLPRTRHRAGGGSWWVVEIVVVVFSAPTLSAAEPPDEDPPKPDHQDVSKATAENPGDGDTPFFFGEIVVVYEGEEPPPGTVDVVDAEALRAAGVVTVGEALELMPGVSLSVGGRNEQKVWVRGYEQSNVLLLVDGVPIADPYYGDLDLGQLPVFDVARITVTRGAASPLYGPNGLGGVISVTTMQGGDSNRVAGELRLTEQRTALAHASASGGAARVSWYLGLGAETSDGWPLAKNSRETQFEDGGTRVNSDLLRSSAMGRVGMGVGDAGTLYASVRWIDAEKGIPFHATDPVGFVKFSRFSERRQAYRSSRGVAGERTARHLRPWCSDGAGGLLSGRPRSDRQDRRRRAFAAIRQRL